MTAPYDLRAGERLAVCGATGTGKTTFARGVLAESSYHWLIFNPKWSKSFAALGGALITRPDRSRIFSALDRQQYTVVNFPASWNWESQDELISDVCERYSNIGICADELYTLHNGAKAGPGLIGLLTRGRELKQSFIGLTQRPSWISRFVFSEASSIVEFRLNYVEDRKIIYEYTGCKAALNKLPNYDYLYFGVEADRATLYRSE